MSNKKRIEQEYLLKTSLKVFENMIFTPSGLSEWFAENVDVKQDNYIFHWDGSDEEAVLLSQKLGSHIRWQWLKDKEEGLDTFFEISYTIDDLTNSVILKIVDYADEEDFEEVEMLWEASVNDLKKVLGT
ncbi:MAG: SRPBCC domain-containing protein [Flavobacteriia bacterium]|nr:SRPBCC domain-containing protein [Flavobacteriia bacterium]